MTSFRRLCWAIFLPMAMTGLFSCGSSGNHYNSDGESGTPLVTIRRSGGLLFNDDQVTVYPDGGFTIKHLSGTRAGATASDTLPPDTFKNLKIALEATSSFKPDYPHAAGFDAYDYSLLYKGRTTTWSDASLNVPDQLLQIGSLFNSAFLIAAERQRTGQ